MTPAPRQGRPGTAEQWLIAGGGAAFVAALALTAWTLAAPFGVVREEVRWHAALWNLLLTSAFALHHSLFARPSVKGWLTRLVPDRLLRTAYVYAASALLALVCLAWQPVGGVVFALRGPAALVVGAIQLLGLLLVVWSARVINPLELAGLRQPPANDAPTNRGPYGFIRHPLYLGWILVVFAPPLMTGDRFMFALLTTSYIVIAIPWEERDLRKAFGGGYAAYEREVRWRLIPHLY